MTSSPNEPGDEDAADREALLIHRAIERLATEDDWRELDVAAAADPDLWRRLGEQLRDECLLASEGRASVAVADRVELPVARTTPIRPLRALRSAFTGWLVAAAALALWIGTRVERDTTAPVRPVVLPAAVPLAGFAAGDPSLLRVSSDGNTSASEMPRVLVNATRSGDGYELLYLRRSFERVRVPMLYDTAHDENGNAAAVPVSLTDRSAWEEF